MPWGVNNGIILVKYLILIKYTWFLCDLVVIDYYLKPEELQKELFCFYQTDWDPYFYINPVKTEVLSEEPLVVQVYEFVNNEALYLIRTTANKTMIRSGVISQFKAATDFQPYRTSMNGWIYDTEDQIPDPVLMTLNRRIEKLLDLEVVKEGASNCQVALYGALGGHYDFHGDSVY